MQCARFSRSTRRGDKIVSPVSSKLTDTRSTKSWILIGELRRANTLRSSAVSCALSRSLYEVIDKKPAWRINCQFGHEPCVRSILQAHRVGRAPGDADRSADRAHGAGLAHEQLRAVRGDAIEHVPAQKIRALYRPREH